MDCLHFARARIGKTRALEVTEPLVPNPIHAVNVTPAYRFRKVGNEEAGLPTILYDEVDTLFGSKVQDTGEVRGLLNAGHRRGAVAGRCVVIGKKVMTEEIPGRKPGSPNKVTLKREAEIAASGLTPLEFMLQQLRDKTKDDSVGCMPRCMLHPTAILSCRRSSRAETATTDAA